VVFPDHLLVHTGGQREFQIPAENYRDLLLALETRFAGIGEVLERCAVAIDGQIYQDAFLEALNTDSEVFFMQRIEGG
jgi:sulfur carrier protein ThiS